MLLPVIIDVLMSIQWHIFITFDSDRGRRRQKVRECGREPSPTRPSHKSELKALKSELWLEQPMNERNYSQSSVTKVDSRSRLFAAIASSRVLLAVHIFSVE